MKIEIKDGHVYKDGDPIATITGDVITSMKALGPTVKGAIKRETENDGLTFIVGQIGGAEPFDITQSPPPNKTRDDVIISNPYDVKIIGGPVILPAPLSDAELVAEMKRRGLVVAAPVAESAKVLSPAEQAQRDEMPVGMAEKIAIFERLTDEWKKGKIPPPPSKHPALGVKTPAFVDWVKNYATADEFELVYPPDRKLPTIEAFNEGEAKRKRIATETTDSKEDRGES